MESTVPLEQCPALVLNSDFRPLSHYPLSIWCWQDTVKAVVLERVNIVSNYSRQIRSPSFEMNLPSVISLKTYIKPNRNPIFSRFNVFLRDKFKCQYCNSSKDLTFDHLIPRSHGGETTWENIVTACSPCNVKKGGKTQSESGMKPFNIPKIPTMMDLDKCGRSFPPNFLHESWMDFLYWDIQLEK